MNFKRAIITGISLLILSVLVLSACSSSQAAGNARIRATWVKPAIASDTVSVPVIEVEKDKIIHFKVSTATDDLSFMVYEYGNTVYARANICPPCQSEGFSLYRDTLVCDTCGTTFNAKTSAGIKGACVRYPKAAVPFETADGKIVMKGADLAKAYLETLQPG